MKYFRIRVNQPVECKRLYEHGTVIVQPDCYRVLGLQFSDAYRIQIEGVDVLVERSRYVEELGTGR